MLLNKYRASLCWWSTAKNGSKLFCGVRLCFCPCGIAAIWTAAKSTLQWPLHCPTWYSCIWGTKLHMWSVHAGLYPMLRCKMLICSSGIVTIASWCHDNDLDYLRQEHRDYCKQSFSWHMGRQNTGISRNIQYIYSMYEVVFPCNWDVCVIMESIAKIIFAILQQSIITQCHNHMWQCHQVFGQAWERFTEVDVIDT